MCAQLHFNMCKEIWVKLDNEHWYQNVPKSVEISVECKVTILRNENVQTDRTIPNNKPETICDNENATCMLTDVARPERKQATATENFDFHISYL